MYCMFLVFVSPKFFEQRSPACFLDCKMSFDNAITLKNCYHAVARIPRLYRSNSVLLIVTATVPALLTVLLADEENSKSDPSKTDFAYETMVVYGKHF